MSSTVAVVHASHAGHSSGDVFPTTPTRHSSETYIYDSFLDYLGHVITSEIKFSFISDAFAILPLELQLWPVGIAASKTAWPAA